MVINIDFKINFAHLNNSLFLQLYSFRDLNPNSTILQRADNIMAILAMNYGTMVRLNITLNKEKIIVRVSSKRYWCLIASQIFVFILVLMRNVKVLMICNIRVFHALIFLWPKLFSQHCILTFLGLRMALICLCLMIISHFIVNLIAFVKSLIFGLLDRIGEILIRVLLRRL